MAKIKIKLDEGAVMPTRAHSSDVGYDVKCLEFYLVSRFGDKTRIYDKNHLDLALSRVSTVHHVEIDTGVHVQPEDGYYVELVPNSRIGKTQLIYGNSFGVIDPEYTGSMKVMLNCVSECWLRDDLGKFLPNNVVGQLIVRKKLDAEFTVVDELDTTVRGDGGFGSTEKPVLGSEDWFS